MASILVVDDDQNIRKVLRELLDKEGFNVLTASDVDKALPFENARKKWNGFTDTVS
jgi:DNA-binding NtrC family response regulator